MFHTLNDAFLRTGFNKRHWIYKTEGYEHGILHLYRRCYFTCNLHMEFTSYIQPSRFSEHSTMVVWYIEDSQASSYIYLHEPMFPRFFFNSLLMPLCAHMFRFMAISPNNVVTNTLQLMLGWHLGSPRTKTLVLYSWHNEKYDVDMTLYIAFMPRTEGIADLLAGRGGKYVTLWSSLEK